MIFDKLLSLKIALDLYRNSKNPLKLILYYLNLKIIIKQIKVIKYSIISFDLLSEFEDFVKVADQNHNSNIIANDYTYSNNKYAQDIIIKQEELNDIVIILRHDKKNIEIDYPITNRFKINKNYKDNIEDNKEGIIKDKYTIIINNSIRNYIYDFIILYMKGEYDNEFNSNGR